jgi:hypothetical protein
MKWLETAWQLVRDVLLTGAGLTLIMLQEFSPHPSGELIGAGLFLLAPAGIQHAVTVILSGPSAPGHGQESSSESSSSPSSSPPLPPAEGTGEREG